MWFLDICCIKIELDTQLHAGAIQLWWRFNKLSCCMIIKYKCRFRSCTSSSRCRQSYSQCRQDRPIVSTIFGAIVYFQYHDASTLVKQLPKAFDTSITKFAWLCNCNFISIAQYFTFRRYWEFYKDMICQLSEHLKSKISVQALIQMQ